jgi:hypothetical protein
MFAGYKTVVAGGISIIMGLATMMGVTIEPSTMAAISQHIDTVVGSGMTLYGLLMIVLRAFTKSPMFKKPE